jgi:hypothetical protein
MGEERIGRLARVAVINEALGTASWATEEMGTRPDAFSEETMIQAI